MCCYSNSGALRFLCKCTQASAADTPWTDHVFIGLLRLAGETAPTPVLACYDVLSPSFQNNSAILQGQAVAAASAGGSDAASGGGSGGGGGGSGGGGDGSGGGGQGAMSLLAVKLSCCPAQQPSAVHSAQLWHSCQSISVAMMIWTLLQGSIAAVQTLLECCQDFLVESASQSCWMVSPGISFAELIFTSCFTGGSGGSGSGSGDGGDVGSGGAISLLVLLLGLTATGLILLRFELDQMPKKKRKAGKQCSASFPIVGLPYQMPSHHAR